MTSFCYCCSCLSSSHPPCIICAGPINSAFASFQTQKLKNNVILMEYNKTHACFVLFHTNQRSLEHVFESYFRTLQLTNYYYYLFIFSVCFERSFGMCLCIDAIHIHKHHLPHSPHPRCYMQICDLHFMAFSHISFGFRFLSVVR